MSKLKLNIWYSLFYDIVLIISSFTYYFILYSFLFDIPLFLLSSLEFLGRFIYFLPLLIFLTNKTGISIKNQLFTPKLAYLLMVLLITYLLFILNLVIAYPKDHVSTFNFSFLFLGNILLAPIFEEIFYRGLILNQLLENHSKFVAITVSSLIFAVGHLNFKIMLPIFFFSIVISFFYIKSGKNLVIPIFAHFVWNLMVELI